MEEKGVIMSNSNEQLQRLSQGYLDASLHFGQISLNSWERLTRFGFASSRHLLEQQRKTAKALAGISDPGEAMSQFNQLLSQSIDESLASSRDLYKILSGTQGELTHLAEENPGTINKSVNEAMESVAKETEKASKTVTPKA
ncbi:phasin family protein [Paludibacterium denitrificans]|uniref:Phasin domain-containing protein n=1 Tax=Paludibacterium denitrificans TaxID=2675226 RepID=A0A844GFY8_9NEIS|nr:phasin family protein [Paludibacterium denitrificans]MTD33425.1 hypothetical protein [Paludibacterium denitrificans]